MARRSATECGAILDIIENLNLIEESQYLSEGRALLMRIVAMLTKMACVSNISEAEVGIGSVHD